MSLYPKLEDESSWVFSDDEDVAGEDTGEHGARQRWPERSGIHRGSGGRAQLNSHQQYGGTGPTSDSVHCQESVNSYKYRGIRPEVEEEHNNPQPNRVTLSAFEHDLLYGEQSTSSPQQQSWRRTWRSSSMWSPSQTKFVRGITRWLEVNGRLKVVVLGCVLGVVCAVLFGEMKSWKVPEDNLLRCPSAEPSQLPCIPDPQLKQALLLATTIRDSVRNRAERYDCGETAVDTRNLTLSDLQLEPDQMSNVLTLILYNPHWQIKWMDSKGSMVTEWTHRPTDQDILESKGTALPLRCQLSLAAMATWSRIQLAVIIVLLLLVVAASVQWYTAHRQLATQATFTMVDRIMEVLSRHYEMSQKKKDLLPYLAIIHVRDMLIPPSERGRKKKVWDKACKWIAEHESRVRVEMQRIAGEDFQVWRWIQVRSLQDGPVLKGMRLIREGVVQVDPPPTEEPSATTEVKGKSRGGNWGGKAFEDYPSSVEDRIAPPLGTPSPCVRLKNMFEPVKRMEEDHASELENSVLDRCVSHGGVVHIFIDRKSTFGCVYFKMDSLKAAMGAYKALHGGWYKGKLVTAKYIPETKYHKWFPRAATATDPLTPSS